MITACRPLKTMGFELRCVEEILLLVCSSSEIQISLTLILLSTAFDQMTFFVLQNAVRFRGFI